MRLRVVSYNIHRGRGLDGRERLDRIRRILDTVDGDVVALQEVLSHQAEGLAEATGMHAVFGPIRLLRGEPYGNLCLSRLPVVGQARLDLTCRPFEPRGAVRADLVAGGHRLSVLNVHFGLHYRERVRQARLLIGAGCPPEALGLVVLGDFNEWFPGRASRLLGRRFHATGRRRRWARTHPSPLPLFALDRIYHDRAVTVIRVGVHRSVHARIASDHLPTFADLDLAALGA